MTWIEAFRELYRNCKKDLKFLHERYKVSYLKAILSNRGFHALCFYRLSRFFYLLKVPIIPLILTRVIQIVYGIDIDYRANIEGGIIIIHGVGTVIGAGVIVEENCIIYHQVTLGIKGIGKQDGFPCIRRSTILGAGAKVLGKVTIGTNYVIGANVVVTFDVPDNSIIKFSKRSFEIKKRKVL